MCLPGGATLGSTTEGMTTLRYGTFGEVAVLGLVVGALEVVDARGDRDVARRGAGPVARVGT